MGAATTVRAGRRALSTVALAVAGVLAPAAGAVDRFWGNRAGGDMGTGSNWVGGVVPSQSDVAVFNLRDPGYTVSFGAGGTNAGLRVQDDTVTFNLQGSNYVLTGNASMGVNVGDVGRLTLNGGQLTVGGETLLGAPAGTTGFLTVGSGALLQQNAGNTRIGNFGTGTLLVNSGGAASSFSAIVAAGAGSDGSATVTGGGSSWQIGNQISIGEQGTGVLNVQAGGSLSANSAVVGNASGGLGSTVVSGFGSSLSVSNSLTVGHGGTGAFSLTGGANVVAPTAVLGGNATGWGSVDVSGPNTLWTSGTRLTVGEPGHGSFSVSDRGTLSTGNAGVGAMPGSVGSVVLRDAGTSWRGSTVTIGQDGSGMLSVGSGATARFSNVHFGSNLDGHGSALVSGAGSLLEVTSSANVGVAGTGSLSVVDGGALLPRALSIATMLGGTGFVTVSGNGSRLETESIVVGGVGNTIGGQAALTVDAGATATATVVMRVHSRGQVRVERGSLNALSLDNVGGLMVIDDGATSVVDEIFNRGTNGEMRLSGDGATVSGALLENSALLTGNGRILAPLSNLGAGEVRVAGSDRLFFGSAGNSNQARISLMDGGTVEFGQGLDNSTDGSITGRGTLIARAGVSNAGVITLSGGESNLVAALGNNRGSRVIVTGNSTATFHRPVTNAGGAEFRVSEGSTAVFLGAVSGGGFTGKGVKIFEAGSSTLGAVETPGTSVVEAPASVSVIRLREQGLTVRGLVTVAADGTEAGRSDVGTLTVEGDGVLDLTNNDLLVRADAAGADSTLARVTEYVRSARNGRAELWEGTGLTSAAARKDDHTTLAVGLVEEGVLVKYTWNGDADLSGSVDLDDYFAIDSNFLSPPQKPTYAQGDFNYDGEINLDDYFLIDFAFLAQTGTLGGAAHAVAVPEPAAAALGLVATLAMRRRRVARSVRGLV